MFTLTCSGIVGATAPGEGNHPRKYSSGRGTRARCGSSFIQFPSVVTSMPLHQRHALRPRWQ
eukprot:9243635-Pyramimonas_sp.AAC.1